MKRATGRAYNKQREAQSRSYLDVYRTGVDSDITTIGLGDGRPARDRRRIDLRRDELDVSAQRRVVRVSERSLRSVVRLSVRVDQPPRDRDGASAAIAVGFAEYFSYFFPALSTSRTVLSAPAPWGKFSISAGQVVAASSIALLGAINYVGVRWGNFVQSTLTVLKIGAMAALPVLALSIRRVTPEFAPVVPESLPEPAAAFGVAMIAVIWTYTGWHNVTSASGEIRDATRAVPRALIFGIVAVMVVYVTINLAYVYSLSIPEMRGVVRIAEHAMGAMLGATGAKLVAAAVVISTFGCNAANIIGMSRMCYAMSSDGLFFKRAAAVHPKYRTPHVAIVLTCAWSILLTLTGTYQQLITYATFAFVLFSVAVGLAIFKLRRSRPGVPRPYRTWGYPAVPVLFVLGSLGLVVNTLIEIPLISIAGLGIVALGLPAYLYWRK